MLCFVREMKSFARTMKKERSERERERETRIFILEKVGGGSETQQLFSSRCRLGVGDFVRWCKERGDGTETGQRMW